MPVETAVYVKFQKATSVKSIEKAIEDLKQIPTVRTISVDATIANGLTD